MLPGDFYMFCCHISSKYKSLLSNKEVFCSIVWPLQNVLPFGKPDGQGFAEDGHNPESIACGRAVAGVGTENTAVNEIS